MRRARSAWMTMACFALAAACGALGGSAPAATAATPYALAAAVRPGDPLTLKTAIDAALTDPVAAKTRIGVHVKDLTSGKVLYAHGETGSYHPASNMKILTTAAALHHLGPAYRFSTTVLYDPSDRTDGRLEGPLYLKGGGDPHLVTETLHRIADEIETAGLKEITGGLVVDQSFFDGARLAPGFEDQPWEDKAFRALNSAAALNFNAVAIDVRPADLGAGGRAEVRSLPESSYLVLDADVMTIEAGKAGKLNIKCEEHKDRDKCTVRGTIAADAWHVRSHRRINHPTRYLGETLMAMLADRGVKLKGKIREGTVPGVATELYRHRGESLGVLVRSINKISSNFMAEQVLRTLGAEIKGIGSWDAGLEVLGDYMTGLGIPAGTYSLVNGSGLFGDAKVAPAHLTSVLEYARKDFSYGPDFVASLAIASTDGTIRSRMSDSAAAGRLRAKTGTLDGVTALSGYVAPTGGKLIAFAILMNDCPKGKLRSLWTVQNEIGAAIAAYAAP